MQLMQRDVHIDFFAFYTPGHKKKAYIYYFKIEDSVPMSDID